VNVLQINKEDAQELSVCVCQSGCRSRSWGFTGTSYVHYPEGRLSGELRNTGSYKPKPNGKSTAAEIGAHGMGLEQAGKLNNTEIASSYWPAKESKTDGWGRVRETSQKHRLEDRPAWGTTSKGPRGITTPNYSNGCDYLWLTGDYTNTCRRQQHQLTAEKQLQPRNGHL
jgi:hypothetical protein